MTTTATKTQKGLLGTKLGMTQVWDETNRLVPVTVIQAGPNVVTQVRDADTDGYAAVQIGYGAIDPRKVTQPLTGHFEKAGVTPRRHVVEIRTADASSYAVGQELSPELFAAGDDVDVTGTSKGKGFAGVMKRHGFHGVSSSHGSHRNHRKPGSIGGCSTPGRVFKGMRMAGRMGGVRQTTQNLTIHAVDVERGLLLVKGAVPGPRGGIVLVLVILYQTDGDQCAGNITASRVFLNKAGEVSFGVAFGDEREPSEGFAHGRPPDLEPLDQHPLVDQRARRELE